jgi:hypothetical protein
MASPNRIIGSSRDLGEVVGRTSSHEIYHCPYCSAATGKEDTQPKLYYNPVKSIGMCFRCNAVVIEDGLRSKKDILRHLQAPSPSDLYKDQIYSLGNWTVPILEHKEAYLYLAGRGFYPDILQRYPVRGCYTPNPGVVYYNREIRTGEGLFTDFISLRMLSGPIRHSFVRDSIKPLAWLHLAHQGDTLAFVEGFSSGLAVAKTDPNLKPVILSGKSISAFQIQQLKGESRRLRCPETTTRALVILDGGLISEPVRLAREIYRTVPWLTDIQIIALPWGKDPNDVSQHSLLMCIRKGIPYNPVHEELVRKTIYERSCSAGQGDLRPSGD